MNQQESSRQIARTTSDIASLPDDYNELLHDVAAILQAARRSSARAVNTVMTATYWEIGRRIVEHEQGGEARAEYGKALLKQLAADLKARFGRGFQVSNLEQMRLFYQGWIAPQISQTVSAKLVFPLTGAAYFPLPWSHYVRLMSVENPDARAFYEAETLRGGWSVRQLNRQIASLFYERTALSKNKAALLRKGETLSPEEEIKDPLVLEFLGLKDHFS